MKINDLPDLPLLTQVREALYEMGPVGGAAVMVGAGFSRFCELTSPTVVRPPLWRNLREAIVKELYGSDPGRAPQDPLVLAQEYASTMGEARLTNLIRQMVPDTPWKPGALHRELLRLPWRDVLTTNWDTLLERTLEGDADLDYSVVRQIDEIAVAKRPRIVKLHGTLPDHRPLIFTEDEFRTYPTEFAPFVNLGRQVLLENELCLIGFSGDDPNFLQWSGWVRDQLGKSARPVRLIGVLNLHASRRKLLEDRNITPIDLTPLTEGLPREAAHQEAMKALLDFLHAGRPKVRPTWERIELNGPEIEKASDPGAKVASIVALLRRNRLARPHWLITPLFERQRARMGLTPLLNILERDLKVAKPDLRAEALHEVTWASRTVFLPLARWIEDAIANTIDNAEDLNLELSARVEIHVAIVREARRRRDWPTFEKRILSLESLHQSGGGATEALYEKLLRARYDLNWEFIAKEHAKLTGDDPIWSLRRAAIAAELMDGDEAFAVIHECLGSIRTRRSTDRKNFWLLAREAWARWLSRSDYRSERPLRRDEEWPSEYRPAGIDPWEELQRLDHEISGQLESYRKSQVTRVPQFDVGTYSTHVWNDRRWESPPRHQLMEMSEVVGIPPSIRSAGLIGEHHRRVAELADLESAVDKRDALWIAVVCHSEYHKKAFDTLEVARLSDATISDLIETLQRAIDYSRLRLYALVGRERTDWLFRLRMLMEILSRLAVRTQGDIAIGLFRLGSAILQDTKLTGPQLNESTGNLIRRSLEGLEPERRKELALEVLQLPLPTEKPGSGTDYQFPEASHAMRAADWTSREYTTGWNSRIAQLLGHLGQGTPPSSRAPATLRLLKLFEAKALTPDETRKFGEELWRHREPDGFPSMTQLYPHVFLRLPGADEATVWALFEEKMLKPLAAGQITNDRLIGLIGMSYDLLGKYNPKSIAPELALAIFKHLLLWSPQPDPSKLNHPDDLAIWGHNRARGVYETLLPALTGDQIDDDLVELVFQRIRNEKAFEFLSVLPALALKIPNIAPRAERELEAALLSSEEQAVSSALNGLYWYARNHANAAGVISANIVSELVSICRARRQPRLDWGIECTTLLVKMDIITQPDCRRLLAAVELLRIATSYEKSGPQQLENGILIRRAALRLAITLSEKGVTSEESIAWINASPSEPLPEVRYALTDPAE